MKIGIFDSGIGGLSVYNELRKTFKNADCIYTCDRKNLPYGTKTDLQLRACSLAMVKRLEHCDVVVAACNSASTMLKQSTKVVTMSGAFKLHIDQYPTDSVLVMGTDATIRSRVYQDMFEERGADVYALACSGLATSVEYEKNKDVDEWAVLVASLVKRYNISDILIGCSHYSFIKERIKVQMDKIDCEAGFIDPAEAVVKEVQKRIDDIGEKKNMFVSFEQIVNKPRVQPQEVEQKVPLTLEWAHANLRN